MRIYETIDGFRLPLDRLDNAERAVFERLYRYARRNPDWNRFTNRWWPQVKELYEQRGLTTKQILQTPLSLIGEDLESRLGVAQRKARPPDYRDELEDLLQRLSMTRYRLAQNTKVSQDLLSHVFRRRKDLSLRSLARLVDSLGYRITFAPKIGPVEDAVRIAS